MRVWQPDAWKERPLPRKLRQEDFEFFALLSWLLGLVLIVIGVVYIW